MEAKRNRALTPSVPRLALVPGGLLHAAGIVLVFGWFLIAAPVFAFIGSVLTKRLNTTTNLLLNTDARNETSRVSPETLEDHEYR